MRKQICCICGKEFDGPGNNPYPVVKNPEERCCDECNRDRVIPTRIRFMRRIDNLLGGEN